MPHPSGNIGSDFSTLSALVILAGIVLISCTHKGIRAWMSGHKSAVHEHLYGPADEQEDPAQRSAPANSPAAPVDSFDYSIYEDQPPG
jgi:hypothetical protein